MKGRLSFGLVLCFGAALGCGDDGSDSTDTTTPDAGADAGDSTSSGSTTSGSGSTSSSGSTTSGATSSTSSGGTSSNATSDDSGEADAGDGGVDVVWGDGGSLSISSPSFDDGDALPEEYTCEGETFGSGISPQLDWSSPAPGTKRYALALVDLTVLETGPIPARAYHWVAYDIPVSVTGIPEEMGGDAQPEELGGGTQVRGGPPTGAQNFFGPCPSWAVSVCPDGLVERSNDSYNFILYTFDDEDLEYPTAAAEGKSLPQTLVEFFEENATERATLAATSNAASIAEGAPAPCPIEIPTDGGVDAGDAGDAAADAGDVSSDAGDAGDVSSDADAGDAGDAAADAGDGG